MSHRATICICRQFPSFRMHAHPGTISKHYSTLLQYFITHHRSDTVLSLARKCSRRSFRFCRQEKRNGYNPEMAGETFLQVLQICKGKPPGRMKDERQAVFCLAGFCVFYAVFSGLAQDPTRHKQLVDVIGQWRSSSGAPSEERNYSM